MDVNSSCSPCGACQRLDSTTQCGWITRCRPPTVVTDIHKNDETDTGHMESLVRLFILQSPIINFTDIICSEINIWQLIDERIKILIIHSNSTNPIVVSVRLCALQGILFVSDI